MATLVALKTSLSATTASFFAALSTASSLRLAVVATRTGPPGCTRRPTHHLVRERAPGRHVGQDDIFSLPSRRPCGPRGVEVRTKLHSAPPGRACEVKSGLHPSMQAMRLSR